MFCDRLSFAEFRGQYGQIRGQTDQRDASLSALSMKSRAHITRVSG
jgi:hypothetical protein